MIGTWPSPARCVSDIVPGMAPRGEAFSANAVIASSDRRGLNSRAPVVLNAVSQKKQKARPYLLVQGVRRSRT